MVLGTATTRTPSRESRSAYDRVSSPPIATSQSSPSRSITPRQWWVKSNGPSDSPWPWPFRKSGTSRGLTVPGLVKPRDVPDFLKGQGQGESEGPFDFTHHCLGVIDRLGLDWLVAIGGDDTLSYAERLSREGVRVVAVPKTMDNDVFGTDYCIGFSTAVTRSVQFIH